MAGNGRSRRELQRAIFNRRDRGLRGWPIAFDVTSIRDATGLEFAVRRLGNGLLGSLGVVGLLLAMIGLDGVVAYAVAARTFPARRATRIDPLTALRTK
jgi:hypothetical protein